MNSPLYLTEKPKTPVICKTNDHRVKQWNVGPTGSLYNTYGSLEVILGVIQCTWDFLKIQFPKHYFYKLQPKFIKLHPSHLLSGPHTSTFGIFEILKIEILFIFFSIFLNMRPNAGGTNFKILLYKSQPKVFKLVLNFPPNDFEFLKS